MKHFILPVAIALSLAPAAAKAQTWMPTGILADTALISIDSSSIKRSYSDLNRISYKIQADLINGTAEARISGNCKTGNYRISSGSKGSKLISLPQDAGLRLHQFACSLPYSTTQPRAR